MDSLHIVNKVNNDLVVKVIICCMAVVMPQPQSDH